MAKYIIKRILAAIPMVLIITVTCFALMNLAPYDAIDAMTTPNMSPETVALIKAKYGYDQPVYIQYIRWLDGLINAISVIPSLLIRAFQRISQSVFRITIKLILRLICWPMHWQLCWADRRFHKNKWADKSLTVSVPLVSHCLLSGYRCF